MRLDVAELLDRIWELESLDMGEAAFEMEVDFDIDEVCSRFADIFVFFGDFRWVCGWEFIWRFFFRRVFNLVLRRSSFSNPISIMIFLMWKLFVTPKSL